MDSQKNEVTTMKEQVEPGKPVDPVEPVEPEDQQELPDHPADRLMVCFEEVEEQEKRLANRRAGDLKYELVNNVYPIIRQLISAVLDFMDDLEPAAETEITEEQEREIRKSMELAVENCGFIVELGEYLKNNKIEIPEDLRDRLGHAITWAKTTIENSKKMG